MRPKHLVPNAITLANIAFGFFAILAAANGRFERACQLIFFAALCDLLDGRMARMLDASSKFGMELDSLSDAISFGITPAVIIYFAVLEDLGWAGAAVSLAYVLCGVLRLARYNCDTGTLGKVTFVGCPIPIAAGYIVSLVMVRHALSPWVIGGASLAIAGSMVSTLKVPKFRAGEGLPFAMLLLGIALFATFLIHPSALTWHVWNGWNLVLIIANYIQLARKGSLEKPNQPELRRAA